MTPASTPPGPEGQQEPEGCWRSFLRDTRESFVFEILVALILVGPPIAGAATGYQLAGTWGALIGAGIGAAGVAAWIGWVIVRFIRDAVKMVRNRRSR